jgi:hypothetical protein
VQRVVVSALVGPERLDEGGGAGDYRALAYGEDAARHMRGHEFYRVALASVSA